MYPALARLADDGFLEHRWELPGESGRPRHLYRLTASGVEFAAGRLASAGGERRVATRGRLAAS
jgi:DNA-binding PadR family transcriptional regulator